jgi:hypothetical protein
MKSSYVVNSDPARARYILGVIGVADAAGRPDADTAFATQEAEAVALLGLKAASVAYREGFNRCVMPKRL